MGKHPQFSERQLDVSLRLVGTGARFGLIAQAVVFVLDFALAIFLARLLGPAGLGVLATVFAISSLIVLIAGLQLETQAARSGHREWAARAFVWSLIAGAGAAAAGLTSAFLLDFFHRPQQAVVLVAYLPFLVLEPAVGLLRGALRAAGRPAAATGYRVLAPLLRIVTLIPLIFDVVGTSPARIAFAFGMAEFTVFLAGVRLTGAGAWIRHHPRWKDLRILMKGYSSLIVIAVTWLILLRTDLIMVAQLVGARAAGGYHITLRLSEVVQQIYSALLVMFLPALASLRDPDDLRIAWRSSSYVTAAILIPLLVPLAVWGDVIVGPIFGQGFVVPRAVYALAAAGLLIHTLSGPAGYVLLTVERNRELVMISVATAILNVVLNAYFIQRWGLSGAALATSLALLAMSAMYVGTAKKTLSFGRLGFSYVPWSLGVTLILVALHLGVRLWNKSLPVALIAGLTGLALSLLATRVNAHARMATDAVMRRRDGFPTKEPG